MLTACDMTWELSKVTYKPGWSFSIQETGWEGPQLRIVVKKVENAYQPGEFNTPLPPMPDADYFHRWVAWRIERVESREVREWFKVDGDTIFDPHAEE